MGKPGLGNANHTLHANVSLLLRCSFDHRVNFVVILLIIKKVGGCVIKSGWIHTLSHHCTHCGLYKLKL